MATTIEAPANTDLTLKLGDAAGTNRLDIQNSSAVSVAKIESDGDLSTYGKIYPGSGTGMQASRSISDDGSRTVVSSHLMAGGNIYPSNQTLGGIYYWDSAPYHGIRLFSGQGMDVLVDKATGDLLPLGTNVGQGLYQDLGDATYYWGDVNHKNLVDRGCLGSFSQGVDMPDGSRVGCVEALSKIGTIAEMTTYGVPRLDYSSIPTTVFRSGPKDEAGRKIGDHGANLNALMSVMLGAINELSARLRALEAKP